MSQTEFKEFVLNVLSIANPDASQLQQIRDLTIERISQHMLDRTLAAHTLYSVWLSAIDSLIQARSLPELKD